MTISTRLLLLLTLLVVGMAAPSLTRTAAAQNFIPHRAIYDLDVLERDKPATFSQVTGRMVYEFDATCEGLIYSHRMLMNLVTQRGESVQSEAVVSFLESKDGHSLRFSVRESYNGRMSAHREGSATRNAVGEIASVTPFRYSRLVFGLILGMIVFHERPDTLSYVGAALILSAGLYSAWRERLHSKR